MNNHDDILSIIKNTITSIVPNTDIVLFGSRARDDHAIDSDYDILVIIPDQITIREKMEYSNTITSSLVTHGINADILIEGSAELETKREMIGTVVRDALSYGIYL